MKAAVVEGPNELRVRDVPEPKVGEYDALCTLLYGATCTGTDSHIIQGIFPFSSPFPTVLGHESVGRVEKVGKKVRNLTPGDVVTRVGVPADPDGTFTSTWGGFAELGIAKDHWAMAEDGLPRGEWGRYRVNQILPNGIDPRFGPMFTPWRETYSAVRRMGVRPGTSVLVIGSGGNGLAIARHAVLAGAAPVVMCGSARVGERVGPLGFHEYYDFRSNDYLGRISEKWPRGFDFVVDALGRTDVSSQAVRLVAEGGAFGIYGMDEYPGVSIQPFTAKGEFRFTRMPYDEAGAHQVVSELVLTGELEPSAWYDIDSTYSLDKIGTAFQDLWEKRGVKALIKLSSDS